MKNSKKMNNFTIACCHGNSLQYTYERKRNPRYVANLHCECQGLKPKGESNSSFLVHPSSGEDIVNTVESHLNQSDSAPVSLNSTHA